MDHILQVLRPAYARRYKMMIDAIDEHLVPLGITLSKVSLRGVDIFGGYFIWFTLPEPLAAEAVAVRAKERENLIVAHGNLFEVYGDEKSVSLDRFIRVCFAWEDEALLKESIVRLGVVMKAMLDGSMDSTTELERTAESLRNPLGEI